MRKVYSLLMVMVTLFSFLVLIALFYLKVLKSEDLSALADAGTALSPFVTIAAIIIAIYTYREQQRVSFVSKGQLLIDQIYKNIQEIRQEINNLYYAENQQDSNSPLNYGAHAAFTIRKHIKKEDTDFGLLLFHQDNYMARQFFTGLITILANIVNVARDFQHKQSILSLYDKDRVWQLIELLVQQYYTYFFDVFDELQYRLNENQSKVSYGNSGQVWFYINLNKQYNSLMNDLIGLGLIIDTTKPLSTTYDPRQYGLRIYEAMLQTQTEIGKIKRSNFGLPNK